jgi:hypothetical protein
MSPTNRRGLFAAAAAVPVLLAPGRGQAQSDAEGRELIRRSRGAPEGRVGGATRGTRRPPEPGGTPAAQAATPQVPAAPGSAQTPRGN